MAVRPGELAVIALLTTHCYEENAVALRPTELAGHEIATALRSSR